MIAARPRLAGRRVTCGRTLASGSGLEQGAGENTGNLHGLSRWVPLLGRAGEGELANAARGTSAWRARP
jgi:hypothetical protein